MTPAETFVARVKAKALATGRDPHELLDAVFGVKTEGGRVVAWFDNGLTPHELASLFHSFCEFWARPEQVFPRGKWRSRIYLGARRAGKTRAVCEWLQGETEEMKTARVILLAQTETKAIDVLVKGESGLLATSPPWNIATWEPSTLTVHWANGALARVLTPGEPQNIRGDGWTHAVLTEIQSWPRATREEAMMNTHIATSASPGKIAGDCTPPKRGRHPILDELLEEAKRDPENYIVVHARIEDNAHNLAVGHVERLRAKVVGAAARAELDGIYDPNVDGALFEQEWIDDNRRFEPDHYLRRIVVIDPAIGTGEASDLTGMGELGLGVDDQVYMIDDMTGKHAPGVWPAIAVDRYIAHGCDLIVLETNRGGNAMTQLVRVAAQQRGWRVEVVDKHARHTKRHTIGVIYVRELNAKHPKAERAAPVASYYEAGKVSHVRGAALAALEKIMTEWTPPPEGTRGGGRRSPDAMDAMVHGVVELAGLARDAAPDAKAAMEAAASLQKRREVPGASQSTSPLNPIPSPRQGPPRGWGNKL